MKDNNNSILNKIFKIFQLNALNVNINNIGNSTNLIYELQNENNAYILRISKQPFCNLSQYEAEMDYVNYLFHMHGNVSKIIPSKNNKLVEVIYDNDQCHFVSVFEKAKGHSPRVDNINEWNDSLFYQWGKAMGKIHCLTKDYRPQEGKVIRKQWNEDLNFIGEYAVDEKDYIICDIWNEIIKEINNFPKDKDSYGLIHNDFHQYNFFIYDGNITIFDFDDCLYHWYVCDIAIAIYHALQTISINSVQERKKFGIKFTESFLKGYLQENGIEKRWIYKIPLFLEYRRICSYNFVLKLWEKDQINEHQKEYLKNIRYNIENRVPCIDINFKSVKEIKNI